MNADILEIEKQLLRTKRYSIALDSVDKYWKTAAELAAWMALFKTKVRRLDLGKRGVEFYIE